MKQKTALLLSWSAPEHDPRVRRMGDSLAARGFDVTAIGLNAANEAARPALPDWKVMNVGSPSTADVASTTREKRAAAGIAAGVASGVASLSDAVSEKVGVASAAGARLRQISERLRTDEAPLSWAGRRAVAALRRSVGDIGKSKADEALRDFWRRFPEAVEMRKSALAINGPALVVANDWQTLPAAVAFVDERGGCVVYDSHEFAREQFAEDPAWRCYIGPIAAAVEARYIPKAAEVTTVSPGIAETLERLYNLPRPIHVLRNTPRRVRLIHRAAAEPPRVLYHGVVAPSRGLENAIAAAALWRDGVSLHIRGPGKADYLQSLAALANRKGVGDRVRFHPAVAVDRLIEEAAAFDIGIFTLADTSLHKRYTLPNKVFEYLAAGLCLVVSDLPELRRLVEDTGAGVLVKEDSAAAIAAAIDQLHTEKLNGYRKAALAAASRYNWEAESPAALDAMEAAWTRAMDQSSGRRAPSFSS